MPIPNQAIMHDAWFALVACALGRLEFLDIPTSFYRQHQNNVLGAKKGAFGSKLIRMLSLKSSNARYRKSMIAPRYRQAQALLERFDQTLTNENSRLIRAFLACEHQNFLAKRASILVNGFLRHSKMENLELLIRI